MCECRDKTREMYTDQSLHDQQIKTILIGFVKDTDFLFSIGQTWRVLCRLTTTCMQVKHTCAQSLLHSYAANLTCMHCYSFSWDSASMAKSPHLINPLTHIHKKIEKVHCGKSEKLHPDLIPLI